MGSSEIIRQVDDGADLNLHLHASPYLTNGNLPGPFEERLDRSRDCVRILLVPFSVYLKLAVLGGGALS
jgi:hypothetical protein